VDATNGTAAKYAAVDPLERSWLDALQVLRRCVELRDEEAPGHLERVSRYSELIAGGLSLSEDRSRLIAFASTLHDAGKVAIPDTIVLKEGKLTLHERRVMQQHTELGYRMLVGSQSPYLRLAATIAWTHHERFDGQGYPRGLFGQGIPLEGRIVAVADVFDALVTDRPYRRAIKPEDGFEALLSERGKHLDPDAVQAFLAASESIAETMQVRTVGSLFGEAPWNDTAIA
jgi:HD-GYP domain-containing protein (c-di-GMP phosphodiesterase class II)